MGSCGPVDRALNSRSEGLGFDSQRWPCVQVLGKLRIPHCLGPLSRNGCLVHRSKVRSIVAGCIGAHLARGKVKSVEHALSWSLDSKQLPLPLPLNLTCCPGSECGRYQSFRIHTVEFCLEVKCRCCVTDNHAEFTKFSGLYLPLVWELNKVVFPYSCPDCPCCPANVIQMDRTAWAVFAAIQNTAWGTFLSSHRSILLPLKKQISRSHFCLFMLH